MWKGEVGKVGKGSVFFCLQQIYIYVCLVSMGCPAGFSHLKSICCQVVLFRYPNLQPYSGQQVDADLSQHPGYCLLLGGNQHILLPT